MSEFSFSGDSLESLAADLQESALRVRVEVDKTVAEVGAGVMEVAKEIAGEHSTKIPGSISLRMTAGAAIIEAGEDVPLAALYEVGNAGRGNSKKDTFGHPVFGKWITGTPPQQRYPFLRPALRRNRQAITKRMEQAWEDALKPLTRGG